MSNDTTVEVPLWVVEYAIHHGLDRGLDNRGVPLTRAMELAAQFRDRLSDETLRRIHHNADFLTDAADRCSW